MIQQEIKNSLFRVSFAFLFSVIFALPFGAEAARVYFEPQELTIGTEKEFFVGVNIDAEEPINAVSVAVYVSAELMPDDVSEGNSIINLWIDKPYFDEASRLLTFSGIIPGGFSGKNARLLVIKFNAAKNEGIAFLGFDKQKTKIYLNTPDGIEDSLEFSPLSLPIVAGKENLPLITPDKDPPEDFNPEIARDPNIFDGQWFLIFTTQDKGSGIAGYAVHESTRKKELTRIETKAWIEAESPYLLKDQKLKSYVYVKAVDKAGNERIAVVEPHYPLLWYEKYLIWIIIILIALIGFFTYLIYRFYGGKNNR